ncbi:MAG: molybdopterin-dependent oxidoreductase [Pseudomonadota bacterium]
MPDVLTSSHWGTGVLQVDDGRVVAVKPHADDPDPSRINENIVDGIRSRARILKPAVRRSYLEHGPTAWTGERGREPFVEVDWDTALDLIAGELNRVRGAHGSGAIFAGSYGWSSAGRFHHAQSQLKRFLNAGGGFVRSEGNYSYNAALVLMPHIVGSFRDHVKQATRWSTVARDGRLVVMFGGIPIRNAQVSGGGVGRHLLRDQMIACAAAGVRFINLSPLRTDALADLDAEWLPPRPGTDTAVMMGIAHTLLAEGLHDREFLDRYTTGFDRLAGYLTGDGDGVAKDADWAAAISGIAANRIRGLARDMAAGRTLITTAAGLQRADFGEQPLWMTVALAAMLGQIGLPGGGYGIGYGADASIGTMARPVHWPSFPQGENPVGPFVPVAMIADMLLNPGASYDYNGRRQVFPDIRMVWWAGGNPFHHHQDLNRLRRAFQKPETIIVNEINWTATARHADIVLPVAAPPERTDFGAGTYDTALVPMPKAIEPAGEAHTEFDIYCALEARMSMGTAFSRGLSQDEWLGQMWIDLRERAAQGGITLPDWRSFLQGDALQIPDPSPDHVLLADFRQDPDRHPLPTPSGRIEIASDVIAGFRYEDCPGHAVWREPRDWAHRADYPIHLLSGQPATRLHSQFDNGSYSRSRKIQDREPILLNTEDAAARGIRDGDIVRVFNTRGACLAGAVVTDEILHGVAFLWTGAWYDPDLDDADQIERHGNPNVLTHDLRTSPLSQGPAAQSALVEISRLDGPVPPVEAFEPPELIRKQAPPDGKSR